MVEIKIDTKKDSKEDIKKAIEFLKQFLEQEISDVPDGAFNIFNQETKLQEDKKESEDNSSDIDIKPIFY
jgi:hypothetical protein